MGNLVNGYRLKVNGYWMARTNRVALLPVLEVIYMKERSSVSLEFEIRWLTRWCAIETIIILK